MTSTADWAGSGLAHGVVLGQRFQVDGPAGKGGMGTAFFATDLESRKRVVVKVPQLPVTAERDPEAWRRITRRFAREGRHLGKVEHPNIPAVVGVGEHGSVPYLVMTCICGIELTEYRVRTVPRPAEFAAIGTAVAGALAACHENGIVHRDLKPDNLLVGENGVVYVIDFGIALSFDKETSRHTRNFVGTDAYAAPERFLGGEQFAPSDLYSLGCVFYHLLTGRAPFVEDGEKTLEKQHLDDLPVPPSQFAAGALPDLEELTLALLAKDTDDRPGVDDVQAVLRPHLPELGAPEPNPVSRPDVTIPYRTPEAVRAPEAPARARTESVRPFRARRRRDFLTEADIAETLQQATTAHEGGDHAAAMQMLTDLRCRAIETFGKGNPKVEPIERALSILVQP
ncbi:serine/threonine-protein kinase [Amycolatopsis magusensis]|uniref:non-specific serine/threonine protein kinase n=1 Tax=Amycolatopsis magusensis TaxID=882444 RepID=A0ABS4Q5B6_9PSEU|nr:serine/threonine-protein kinase [Amycolatopsis magusensis]MBP2186873.1 serine/threonine-protein kinase [Amycolatopsis magusensis]